MLIVADGAPGLIKAVEQCWPASDRQHWRLSGLLCVRPRLVVGVQSGIRSSKWILRARSAAVQRITFFHLTSARMSAR
jgi:hypothetical protein